MSESDCGPWIYAGNCPVCECGLRRIRVSTDGPLTLGYVMCDECEAMWSNPSCTSDYRFPDPQAPLSPAGDMPLYGPQSRWATVEDVCLLGWLDQVTIDDGCASDSSSD